MKATRYFRENCSRGTKQTFLRLVFSGAIVVASGGQSAIAADIFRIDGGGSGAFLAQQAATGVPSLKASTKLTLGLGTLSAEYQAYLQSAAGGTAPIASFQSRATMVPVADDSVVIDAVATDDPQVLKADLEALGATVTAVAGRVVSARVHLSLLPALEGIDSLKFARPALAIKSVGSVTSQGDPAQRSNLARIDFGVDGTGETVGVLSDSFDCSGNGSYALDQSTGDLPAGVNVLDDTATACTDEGRAMAQIVYDVAPGAGLAFHTASNGEANFAQGILDLAAAGSTVIVDDVLILTEPMFQDGVIAQAVDQVNAAGVPYFSSAGNSARQSYEAPFRRSGIFVNIGYGPQEFHDFDPGPGVDIFQACDFNGESPFSLQWNQPFFSVSGPPGSASDIDICLFTAPDASGLLGCSASGNFGADPVEIFGLGWTGTVYFAILHYEGAFPELMKYVWFRNAVSNLEYATNSSTSYGHANASGANSVGAAFYGSTPAFGTDPPRLEDFSSAGGIPILFDTSGNATYELRQKPEFTAPDGGNNTFFGGIDPESDGFPNFFGTSAAAPHAAGVAALLLELDPTVTPDAITSALQNSAVDILARDSGAPTGSGYDNDSGSGLIDADAALGALGGGGTLLAADKVAIWRPSDHRFYLDANGSGAWDAGDVVTAPFGIATDIPVTGDWNGGGVAKVGIWRPSDHRFYLDANGSGAWDAGDVVTAPFGIATDIPVTGDWTGGGVAKVGIWRPSDHRFYLDANGSGAWDAGDVVTAPFGIATDIPVTGDWTGGGVAKVGIWRPSDRKFYLDANGSGAWDAGDVVTAPFGIATDIPVTGDWNGGGVAKVGIWRPSDRKFYLDANGSGAWDSGDLVTAPFGVSTDRPVTGPW
jgi:hypothetical protein